MTETSDGVAAGPRLSVTLPLWQDRPAHENLDVAAAADRLGYDRVWVGEMATYDAFALATAAGTAMRHSSLVIGPLAVTVRDPMMIAMGAASVADLTGRRVDVALGTSSAFVVEAWHGRSMAHATSALGESAQAVRGLLSGTKVDLQGRAVGTAGFRLRVPPTGSEVTVAAFGPRALRAAAAYGDRLVLNLVDAPTVRELAGRYRSEAADPRVSLWVCAAAAADEQAMLQLRSGIVGYLMAPGYGEMFRRAGFGRLVDFAMSRPHPREVLERVPDELIRAVAMVGGEDEIAARVAEYREAGVDEIVVVPACTDTDPAGEAILELVARVGR